MWKNVTEPGRPQMAIWCMSISCGTHKATNTHSDYVILIAFPLQQLFERSSLLYVHCLSRCVPCVLCTHWNNGILWVAVRDGSISVESVPSKIETNHFFLQSEIYLNNN
jgi:hypothetical protein